LIPGFAGEIKFMQTPPQPLPRWLRALLGATAALPALAIFPGRRAGSMVYVLYREPKLAAVQILGWSALAALFWVCRSELQPRALLSALLRPPWRWLALFLVYGLITALWVAVPANLFYELNQYALLLLLIVALELAAERDPAVPRIVEHGLVISLGVAAVAGLVQGVFPLSFLSPIDPGSGVPNPSFLGYKNPMALALVGQVFLLAHLALRRRGSRGGRLLLVLLAAELVYLASLKSRTSYVALLGAAAVLGLLLAAREGMSRRLLRVSLAGAVAVCLFLGAVAADPATRSRAGSVLSYLGHPAGYLESDRGTYLVNSLQMVRDRPFGVGLGDWQTQYPVYRRVHRDLYFTAAVQVRKAHSDHVQILAETGWPGFALWSLFWVSLLAAPVRRYLRTGEAYPLLLAVQLAAFAIAMATDYVAEHPYLKFEFLLVAFLGARAAREPVPEQPPAAGRARSWPAVAATAVALAVLAGAVCHVRKAALAAAATGEYLSAVQHLERRGGPGLDAAERALLEAASRAGEALARTPGTNKGLSDDYRILAQTEMRLGNRPRALAYVRASLRLHPYSPNTMWLLADLLHDRQPAAAARWSHAADYVMNAATHGFTESYPVIPQ
jgi:O-antigen ligase